MKNLILFAALAAACACSPSRQSAPGFAAVTLDGRNLRSKQPTEAQLKQAFDSGIKTVIRLNAEKSALSVNREKQICEKSGVKFHYFNIEGTEKLNWKNLLQIAELLDKGNCLIHCKHGHDRTGAAVAFQLRRNGYSTEKIINHNSWKPDYPTKGEGYQKYYSCAY